MRNEKRLTRSTRSLATEDTEEEKRKVKREKRKVKREKLLFAIFISHSSLFIFHY